MKTENTTLHAVKALACFSIVSLHFLLPGEFGIFYQIVARFAVPFFMMLSGYFSFNISREMVKYRLKQMLLLTVASLLFYSIVHFIDLVLSGELAGKIATIDLSDFADFFFFNSPRDLIGPAATPTWYLLAISYIYGLYLLFYKYFHHLTTFGVSLILLALAFCIEFNTNSTLYYRNFLFMGLPFFIMGMQFAKYRERILAYDLSSAREWAIGLGIIGLILLEYCFMGTEHDLYPSTLLSSSAIFLYAIRNGTNIDVPILNNIAKRYATMIYIIHPFIIFIFRQLMPRNDIYSFGFFIILLLSYLLSVAFQKVIIPRIISLLPA
jgi:transmembrane protein